MLVMHRISGFRPQNLVLRPSSKPRPRVAPELFSPSSQEIGDFFFVWVNSGQFLVEKNMSCYFLATRFYNHDFFPTRFYIWWDCTTVLRRQVFVVRKSLLGLALLVVFWIQFFVVTSNQESGPLVIRKMQVDRGFWKVSRLKVLLTTLPKTNSKRRWK